MGRTVAEYEKLLEESRKSIVIATEKLKKSEEERKTAEEHFSDVESVKHVCEFAVHRNKTNKTGWIFCGFAGGGLVASLLYSAYWMKDPTVHNLAQGFRYNGMPTIMIVVAAVCLLFGISFFCIRQIKGKKLSAELAVSEVQWKEAADWLEKCRNGVRSAENLKKEDEKKYKTLLDTFYEEYPEELHKVNVAREKEKQKALEALRAQKEFELQAAENAKKKQEDLMTAQKMFDHPQAYVLDGLFENEYEVFCRSAELGCQDAQVRVVEILLGITYKSGVKADVAKGEETALHYGSDFNNNAMYEILGKGYLYGEGNIPKNEEKALKYLEKAAAKGRQKAMIMAAVCHYNGIGTERDEQRARTFFAKAAKQGNEQAMKVLAAMDNGEKLRF